MVTPCDGRVYISNYRALFNPCVMCQNAKCKSEVALPAHCYSGHSAWIGVEPRILWTLGKWFTHRDFPLSHPNVIYGDLADRISPLIRKQRKQTNSIWYSLLFAIFMTQSLRRFHIEHVCLIWANRFSYWFFWLSLHIGINYKGLLLHYFILTKMGLKLLTFDLTFITNSIIPEFLFNVSLLNVCSDILRTGE